MKKSVFLKKAISVVSLAAIISSEAAMPVFAEGTNLMPAPNKYKFPFAKNVIKDEQVLYDGKISWKVTPSDGVNSDVKYSVGEGSLEGAHQFNKGEFYKASAMIKAESGVGGMHCYNHSMASLVEVNGKTAFVSLPYNDDITARALWKTIADNKDANGWQRVEYPLMYVLTDSKWLRFTYVFKNENKNEYVNMTDIVFEKLEPEVILDDMPADITVPVTGETVTEALSAQIKVDGLALENYDAFTGLSNKAQSYDTKYSYELAQDYDGVLIDGNNIILNDKAYAQDIDVKVKYNDVVYATHTISLDCPIGYENPQIRDLVLTGTLAPGNTLRVNYTFYDPNGISENKNSIICEWWGKKNNTYEKIPCSDTEYSIEADNEYTAVYATVQTENNEGRLSERKATNEVLLSQLPTVGNVILTGDSDVGSELNVTYTYHDVNDLDVETDTIVRWYRSETPDANAKEIISDKIITDETSKKYTTAADDIGMYIYAGVTPVNAHESGSEVFSNRIKIYSQNTPFVFDKDFIRNGGAEKDIFGWSANAASSDNALLAVTDTTSRSGKYCFELSQADSCNGMYQKVWLDKGKYYEATAWVKSDTDVNIGFEALSDGLEIDGKNNIASGTEWSQVRNIIYSSDDYEGYIGLCTDTDIEKLYIDDIKVVEAAPSFKYSIPNEHRIFNEGANIDLTAELSIGDTAIEAAPEYLLAKEYEGVSISGNMLNVSPETVPKTIAVNISYRGYIYTHELSLVKNNCPIVKNVIITGSTLSGGVLNAEVIADNATGFTYQWYTSDNPICELTPIDGNAQSSSYTLTDNEINKYVWVGVTPANGEEYYEMVSDKIAGYLADVVLLAGELDNNLDIAEKLQELSGKETISAHYDNYKQILAEIASDGGRVDKKLAFWLQDGEAADAAEYYEMLMLNKYGCEAAWNCGKQDYFGVIVQDAVNGQPLTGKQNAAYSLDSDNSDNMKLAGSVGDGTGRIAQNAYDYLNGKSPCELKILDKFGQEINKDELFELYEPSTYIHACVYPLSSNYKAEFIPNDYFDYTEETGMLVKKQNPIGNVYLTFRAGNLSKTIAVKCLPESDTEGDVKIYVSPDGLDVNDGTIDSPLKTLNRAKIVARKYNKEFSVDIVLREGRYYLENSFTLTGEDSGLSPEKPVRYIPYEGENVIVTGEKLLDSTCFYKVTDRAISDRVISQKAKKHLYAIDAKAMGITLTKEKMRGLNKIKGYDYGSINPIPVLNNIPGRVAKWPDDGNVGISEVVSLGNYSKDDITGCDGMEFKIATDRPKLWKNADDAYIWSMWDCGFADQTVMVSDISEDNTIKTDMPAVYLNSEFSLERAGLEFYNLLEEISQNGEYYADTVNQKIYFMAENIDNLGLIILNDNLVSVNGASNIIFKDITFTGSRKNAIEIKNCEDVIIDGCTIENIGVTAFECVYSAAGCGLINSEVRNVGAGANIYSNKQDKKNYIINCLFENFGIQCYEGGIAPCGNSIVRNNTIRNSRQMAIEFSSSNNVIEYNDISNVLTHSGDMGVFYANTAGAGNGNIIRNNYVHDIHTEMVFDGGIEMIYLDKGTSNTKIYYNVFENISGGGIDNPEGGNNEIISNVFISCHKAISRAEPSYKSGLTLTCKDNIFFGEYSKKYDQLINWQNKGCILIGGGTNYENDDISIFADYDNKDFSLTENAMKSAQDNGMLSEYVPLDISKCGYKQEREVIR